MGIIADLPHRVLVSLNEFTDVKYLEYVRYYLVGNRAMQRQTQSGYLRRAGLLGCSQDKGRVDHPCSE